MDNLRATIDVLFNRTPVEDIMHALLFDPQARSEINGLLLGTSAARGKSDWFCRDLLVCEKRLSDDQSEAVFQILHDTWVTPPEHSDLPNRRSPFNVMLHFTKEVLHTGGLEPECRYPQLLRWHMLSNKVGQDMLTTAALAARDVVTGYDRTFFGWKPIIGHDNPSINHLLSKGLHELHFHLNGSSLNFEVNWLSLMNHIGHRGGDFKRLETRQSAVVDHFDRRREREMLHALCIKACAIRLLLFNEGFGYCGLLSRADTLQLLRHNGVGELTLCLNRLESGIENARQMHGRLYEGEVVDYAIPSTLPAIYNNAKHEVNTPLVGEREILYRTFRRVLSGDECRNTTLLLWAYLAIKCRLRDEIVQLNDRVGFANFQKYQNRKTLFVRSGSIYERLIPQLAVRSSLLNQRCLRSIEARIAPQKKWEKSIRRLDKVIVSKRVHYVVHFLKRTDDAEFKHGICRHSKLREKVYEDAVALNNFRNGLSPESHRIVGIDAASTEIGCRPEVFAQVFRFLRDIPLLNAHPQLMDKLPQRLGVTYHVGEDFMDLADGLRAVDEAILFLNMKEGDRLGHALVLGHDAPLYYKHNHHTAVCTQLDWLDNVVWLAEKAQLCSINVPPSLQAKLQRWFEELFRAVYPCKQLSSMHTYYLSWLLRGDNPYGSVVGVVPWDRYAHNRAFNGINDVIGIARNNSEARELFQLYHFDEKVRREGALMRNFKVCEEYVGCIIALQKSMLHEVARKHLCIETNLSSNRVIAGLDNYCVHPITRFFNAGLGNEDECPQISVSINTDDQGVFHTSIENEFALMGLAMEKNSDTNGLATTHYKPHNIHTWLNRIREFSAEQQFFKP